jgi:hypothetical protein
METRVVPEVSLSVKVEKLQCSISGLALIHPCNVGTTLHAAEAAQSGPIASKCKSRGSVLVIPTWSVQATHQSLRCSVELRWIRPTRLDAAIHPPSTT